MPSAQRLGALAVEQERLAGERRRALDLGACGNCRSRGNFAGVGHCGLWLRPRRAQSRARREQLWKRGCRELDLLPRRSQRPASPGGPNVLRIVIIEWRRWDEKRRIGAAALLALALLAAGCGSGAAAATTAASTPTTRRRWPGRRRRWPPCTARGTSCSPAAQDAYEKRIAALRGYPVVVNVWASWCGPCRFEFPTLQKLSAKYGKRVAFLGVNSEDSDDAAKTFLAEAPGPLPQLHRPGQGHQRQRRRQLRLPRHRLLRPRAASSSSSNRASTPTKANSQADIERCALARRMRKRIIGVMDAFVVIALIAVALLLAELLLPTGGVLAVLGASA